MNKGLDIYDRLQEENPDFSALRRLCSPDSVRSWIIRYVGMGMITRERSRELYELAGEHLGRHEHFEHIEARVEGNQQRGFMVTNWDDILRYHRARIEREARDGDS